MTDELKKELLNSIFNGASLNNAQINVVVESGAKVCYTENESNKQNELTDESLANLVESTQPYWWGKASWAVIFCYCRDKYKIDDNMAAFERRIERLRVDVCTKNKYTMGTINRTISNNLFMKLDVDKWESNGVSARVVRLLNNLKKSDDCHVE